MLRWQSDAMFLMRVNVGLCRCYRQPKGWQQWNRHVVTLQPQFSFMGTDHQLRLSLTYAMGPIGLRAIMVLWLVFFPMASVHCHKTKLYFAMIDPFVVWYFRQYLSPQGFCSIPLQLLPLHKVRWVTHSWHFRKWSWTFTFCFLALRMIRTMKFP